LHYGNLSWTSVRCRWPIYKDFQHNLILYLISASANMLRWIVSFHTLNMYTFCWNFLCDNKPVVFWL
jgi:hypothetical protein